MGPTFSRALSCCCDAKHVQREHHNDFPLLLVFITLLSPLPNEGHIRTQLH
jgi:hypothetical protein